MRWSRSTGQWGGGVRARPRRRPPIMGILRRSRPLASQAISKPIYMSERRLLLRTKHESCTFFSMVYDVRAIANLILDLADEGGRKLTNMQINKVVYFVHADYLAAFGVPLVSAKIEAWEHGPVFRELYHEFKKFGDLPIAARSSVVDPRTGIRGPANASLEPPTRAFVEDAARKYSSMTASALRSLSHVDGGPWDQVWNHVTSTQATMRISDEAILGWYRSAKH